MTAGAELLGVGQPAVSRQIQQLERQLCIKLFDRQDGRLRLTSAGADVLPAARRLLRQADDVADAARGVAAGRLQRVRLASTGTTRDDVLAPWLATWRPQDPMPSISEAGLDDLYAMLRRSVDLVVAPLAPPPDLASRVIADLGLWACVPVNHPWAGRSAVPVAELAEVELLLLERPSHARRALEEALEAAGVGVTPRAEFTSPVVAQAVAASGRGICVLTDDPRFDLVPLGILGADGQPVRIRLHAAWDPAHHAAATLSELAAGLSRFTLSRYGAEPADAPPASA